MISKIKVENFKAILNAEFELRNLNFLTGLNGMGKSSLIQILLLLKQSSNINGLKLNGEYCKLGYWLDVLSIFAAEEKIKIKIEQDNNKILNFVFQADKLINPEILECTAKTVTEYHGFNSLIYLSAERINPNSSYQLSLANIQEKQIGVRGEYAIHYLAHNQNNDIPIKNLKHPLLPDDLIITDENGNTLTDENGNTLISETADYSLLSNTMEWLREISPGVGLKTLINKELDLVKLSFNYLTEIGQTTEFRPTNVGFGITYTLPIIVAVLSAAAGDILIIENPESHIHPRGQSKLGQLFAIAAENGVQIIIETHSDHIINGIRLATKTKYIQPENVIGYYFHRTEMKKEHASEIIPLKIDENGKMNKFPEGFLDEWNKALMKLVKK